MRSFTLIPLVLSVVLHAGALVFVRGLHWQPATSSALPKLSISLAPVPTLQVVSLTDAQPMQEQSISAEKQPVSTPLEVIPEAKPDGEPLATAPSAEAPESPPEAAPAVAQAPVLSAANEAGALTTTTEAATEVLRQVQVVTARPVSPPQAPVGSPANPHVEEAMSDAATAAHTQVGDADALAAIAPIGSPEAITSSAHESTAAAAGDLLTMPAATTPSQDSSAPPPDLVAQRTIPSVPDGDHTSIADQEPQITPEETTPTAAPPTLAPPPRMVLPNDLLATAQQPLNHQPTLAGALPETTEREAPTTLASTAPDETAASDNLDLGEAEAKRRNLAFVEQYDGGPCVFLAATDVAAARTKVDAFATSNVTFSQFHQRFEAVAGFEPEVIGQKIWTPQCPVVDLLREMRAKDAIAPVLELETVTRRVGATVRGSVFDPAHRPLQLFVVSETGAVENVSFALQSAGELSRFTLPPVPARAGGPYPQLLLAIAGGTGAVPLASGGLAASDFIKSFPEAAWAQVGAAAKLLLLSN